MGGYRWLQIAVLTLIGASGALATERVNVDPYIKAGPGYTSATGSLTGYIPTKDTQSLLLEAERKGWLGPPGSSAKTPLDLKANVKVPISGITSKLKNILKTTPGSLAVSAATAAALAAIDGVMSEDNTSIQIPTALVDEIPVGGEVGGTDPIGICSVMPASKTMNKITVMKYNGVTYAVYVGPFGTVPSGYTLARNNCTQRHMGYQHNEKGYWPQSAARAISIDEISESLRGANDSDFDKLDPWVSAQTGPFLRDLLRDVCAASPSPQRCFDDLQKQSPPSIRGPSSVAGPVSTTSGTYSRPDGSTGTTSTTTNTTYDITYGNNYYDYSTTTTTTTTKDGVTTGTESTTDAGPPVEEPEEDTPPEEQYTFEDAAFPEVEPFYEQQYPDGLEGVWNARKQSFENSAFIAFLQSFIPSFSGSCPSWSMSFNLSALGNFSSHGFGVGCYIFDFIGSVILVTALFTARAVTFGG